jgi:hypothetical protein
VDHTLKDASAARRLAASFERAVRCCGFEHEGEGRMGRSSRRSKLGLVGGADEESVIYSLKGAGFERVVARRYVHAVLLGKIRQF